MWGDGYWKRKGFRATPFIWDEYKKEEPVNKTPIEEALEVQKNAHTLYDGPTLKRILFAVTAIAQSKEIPFNVNSWVKVKLTPKGKEILNTTKKFPTALPVDEQGYCKFQLWVFMQYFGDSIYLGCPDMFDTNIILIKD